MTGTWTQTLMHCLLRKPVLKWLTCLQDTALDYGEQAAQGGESCVALEMSDVYLSKHSWALQCFMQCPKAAV